MFYFLSVLILQLLWNSAIGAKITPAVNCSQFKYSVQHQFDPTSCTECRICPDEATRNLHNENCKSKVPYAIPGQGRPWCTGSSLKAPWCPALSVTNGKFDCGKYNNSVYSTCTLQCDSGYSPVLQNLTNVTCEETLKWSVLDTSLLKCQRIAGPGKPSISSPGQGQAVRSGSDKTLTCKLSSEIVGSQKTYWYYKDKILYSDPEEDTYVVHGATKENEGKYFCRVMDQIGMSELSSEYFLKVEETYKVSDSSLTTGVVISLTVFGCIFLLFILCCKWQACNKFASGICHRIISCNNHNIPEEVKKVCLSSGTTITSISSGTTSGTCSTTDLEGNGEDNKKPLLPTASQKLPEQKQSSTKNGELQNDFVAIDVTKPEDMKHNDASSSDQNNLRLVYKDWDLMKKLKILLDQEPTIDQDKPNFKSLGQYLGANLDEVHNFEFNCQQKHLSPTETYLKKMTEEGRGLTCLLSFLKSYKHTENLAKEIVKKIY